MFGLAVCPAILGLPRPSRAHLVVSTSPSGVDPRLQVYVWSRRNPHVQLNFLGVATFAAPYLPWVLLTFSLLVGGIWKSDVMGIMAGHVYYFFEDVYPRQGGPRILKTPQFMHVLFDRVQPM